LQAGLILIDRIEPVDGVSVVDAYQTAEAAVHKNRRGYHLMASKVEMAIQDQEEPRLEAEPDTLVVGNGRQAKDGELLAWEQVV